MKKGFKPLPISLQVIFVILSLGVIFGIFSLNSIATAGVPLLSMQLQGTVAAIWFLVMMLASATLLVAMWQRYPWTVKYAYIWFIFGIINTLAGIPQIQENLENTTELNSLPPEAAKVAYVSAMVALSFGIAFNALCIFFFYKHKKYFEKK